MKSGDQIEQAAAYWLIRRDRGALTAEEQAEFNNWLNASVLHRRAYLLLESAWRKADGLRQIAERPGVGLMRRAGWRASMSMRHAALAAAVLASVMLGLAGSVQFPEDGVYRTSVGGREEFPLPDGSRITLNTDSDIRVDFSNKERRIELRRGEAYFDVSPDANRPFVVQAGAEAVVAVGTRFSVRRQRTGVRVLVEEGRVRLERRGTELTAGAVAQTDDIGVVMQLKPVGEILDALKWREGLLVFRGGTLLREAVAEINRYNMRQIRLEGAETARVQIGGEFASTDLESFLGMLERQSVFAEHRGHEIILTKGPAGS